MRRWDPNTPIAVSPTIRIANKRMQKVEDYWPLTLEDWDRREAEIEAMRNAEYTSGTPPLSSKSLADAVPEPAFVIRFVVEFGCLPILLAVFYQRGGMEVSSDWDNPRSYTL